MGKSVAILIAFLVVLLAFHTATPKSNSQYPTPGDIQGNSPIARTLSPGLTSRPSREVHEPSIGCMLTNPLRPRRVL